MKTEVIDTGKIRVLDIKADNGIVLKSAEDALDILANAGYGYEINKIIIRRENIIPDFFDLKTKIAGDILQKFSTYNGYLAIIGDFADIQSKSLHDFIRESNKQGRILFKPTVTEALEIFG